MQSKSTTKKGVKPGPELVQLGCRVYKKVHPPKLKKLARHFKESESAVLRRAIDELAKRTLNV